MSEQVRRIIFEQPVLLSPATEIGKFVARRFYHEISGFGIAQTQYDVFTNPEGTVVFPEVEVTWQDFGRFEGYKAHWSIGDGQPDELSRLNNELRDDQLVGAEIKEMIDGQVNDEFSSPTGVRVILGGQEISLSDAFNPDDFIV